MALVKTELSEKQRFSDDGRAISPLSVEKDADLTATTGILDPSSLPHSLPTLCSSYGAAHDRPVLALSRPVGTFHVDLNTFKVGMTVSCKILDTKEHSCGWFPGIINRILDDAQHADIDYDNGTYDYNVPFKRLRIRSNYRARTFNIAHNPLPFAIVLSNNHAREAVARALRLIEKIKAEGEGKQSNDDTFSTPSHSRPSTPPAVITVRPISPPTDDDDEVKLVMGRFGSSRESRPIVL